MTIPYLDAYNAIDSYGTTTGDDVFVEEEHLVDSQVENVVSGGTEGLIIPSFPEHKKLLVTDSLQREIAGIVVAFDDDRVEVALDSQSIVLFPRSLFRDREDLLSHGQLVKYQIMKRADSTRFQRFVEDADPTAESANKDLFDLWDSITSE